LGSAKADILLPAIEKYDRIGDSDYAFKAYLIAASPSAAYEFMGAKSFGGNALNEKDTSLLELIKIVDAAQQERVTKQHALNSHSSRSHAIITVVWEYAIPASGPMHKKTLNLIDLAGSQSDKYIPLLKDEMEEKLKRKRSQLIEENKCINRSLSTLHGVIKVLVENKLTFSEPKAAPFRQSKLTQFLHKTLENESKVVMLLALSPELGMLQQTRASLHDVQDCLGKYANVPTSEDDLLALGNDLTEEETRIFAEQQRCKLLCPPMRREAILRLFSSAIITEEPAPLNQVKKKVSYTLDSKQ
jgi:hypothetical protein